MLNPILIGFGTSYGKGILESAFHGASLGHCLSVCIDKNLKPDLEAKEHEWLNHRACQFGDYPTDWRGFDPIDEELIEKMRDCETVFMRMMDRLERGKMIPYQQRRRAYLRHLRYWNHIIEHKKINLYLSTNYPHECFDFVLYHLCKLRGIQTVMLRAGLMSIPDVLFLDYDWEKPSPGLKEKFEELKKKYAGAGEGEICLAPKFEKEIAAQTEAISGNSPWYMSHSSSPKAEVAVTQAIEKKKWRKMVFGMLAGDPINFARHSLNFMSRVFTAEFWAKRIEILQRKRATVHMRRFYNSHADIPDLSKKYIYLPLHYQPECTTCPMAGEYRDQLLIAELLHACLPEDVLIYVKEHPMQGEVQRSIEFYRDLISIPTVRLVPLGFDSTALLENSLAVATATGTAGFEALFRGVPFLMFGHRFMQYGPGVFPIRTEEDCKKAIEKILSGERGASFRDLKIFLKAIEEVSIEGYVEEANRDVSRITEEECVRNVGGAIKKYISCLAV